MPRPWRGPLCVEGIQTGDGRVIARDASVWPELPIPLAWIVDGDQHVHPDRAPQVGVITSITRQDDQMWGEGTIDDEGALGAELVRRLEQGQASHGNRQYVSIDMDDYEVEVVMPEAGDQEEEIIIIASAAGSIVNWLSAPRFRLSVLAAAGDPDPGPGGGPTGETLMAFSSDEIIERHTRLRIRGATCCAVSAFTEAWIELADVEAVPGAIQPLPAVEEIPAEPGATTVAAALAPRSSVVVAHAFSGLHSPPAEWFRDPQLQQLERWMTILDSGQWWTHLAGWGECHIGYQNICITPEELCEGGFDFAQPGHVVASNGQVIGTMPIAVKGGHADTREPDWRKAQAHYDDPDAAKAVGVVGRDVWGVWAAGALKPTATHDDVYTLRAHGVSGDWRRIGGLARLIGACCINIAGFPKAKAHVANGELVAVVAAGGRPLSAFDHMPKPIDLDEIRERRLRRIERATEDLVLAHLDARVRPRA